MKKFLPIIVVVIVGIAAGGLAWSGSNKKTNTTATANGVKKFSPPQACTVFTLDDAKKVLGGDAKNTEIPASNASSDDIEVTQCFYEQPSGNTLESIKNQRQASVLVRAAKTEKGEASNVDYFKGSTKPTDVQDVNEYGDGAHWNSQFGQLNILKSGNWYILSVGSPISAEKKLEDTKVLADILIDRL